MSIAPLPAAPNQPSSGFARFLNPRGIAVVGASRESGRIGGQALNLLTGFGYSGGIYPVNPRYADIGDLRCYPDIAAVPQPCDLALIALTGSQVQEVVTQCGQSGIRYAIVLSSGFSEVGAEGKGLQDSLVAAARDAGVRVLGPNCLGMLNLKDNVRTGFGGTLRLTTLKPGPVAMVTQSGGFGFGVVAMACHAGVGFNYVISTGNEADITTLDLLADLLERPEVEVLTTFMEGINDGRRMMAIGERALELGKPILAWKVGNTSVGRQAATSHSARLTAGYELYRAAFRRGGYIEIREVDELVDICKAFGIGKLPAGNRVAIMTVSGGAGVLIADRCLEQGLEVPALAPATTANLRAALPAFACPDNPIDVTAQGYNDNFAAYRKAVGYVLADPTVDQVIARVPRGSAAKAWADGVLEMLSHSSKPLLIDWSTAPDDNGDVLHYLDSNKVPCIPGSGRAVRAVAALSTFAQRQRARPTDAQRDWTRVIARQHLQLPDFTGILGEYRAKTLLRQYGVPTVDEHVITLGNIEQLAASPLPFPLAVKIESADIPHKTEAGAVRLNITDLAQLKQAARDVTASALSYKPDARIDGVLVQRMAGGVEVIVGAIADACFGPVVTFGLGGVFTELLGDVTHGFAPFGIDEAKKMITEIKAAPLLLGYRGKPALDVEALADVLSRVSLMIADHADRIAEIDINPLFVRPAGEGVVAADALIVLRDVASSLRDA